MMQALVSAIQDFFGLFLRLPSLVEIIKQWWAVAALALLLGLYFRDIWRCYRLLRVMRAGQDGGERIRVLATIVRIAIPRFPDILNSNLFRRVRMRVEHEIFPPTPSIDLARFQSPMTGKINTVPGDEAGAKRVKLHLEAEAKWKSGLSKIHSGDPTIRIANAADVNLHFDEIDRYFDVLAHFKVKEDGKYFICPIEIGSGFIAPLHLLTGLLVEFNQKWGNILTAFNRDAAQPARALGNYGGDIREIQMFIYTCWILWGPSIPVCGCEKSDARFRSIQYGFGDENNSLEVVGASPRIDALMAELMAKSRRHMISATEPGKRDAVQMPMALPVMVRGRLRLSDSIGLDPRDTNALPGIVNDSWRGGADRRPVLYISTIKQGAEGASAAYEAVNVGEISLEDGAVKSKYYSAYLWIAFVMMEERDGVFTPFSERSGKSRPWTDLIPFFEHGNLADPESCAYGKAQLAAKVADALASVVKRLPEGTTTRFVFACSIDDPGCDAGAQPLFNGWQGGSLIRDMVRDRIEQEADRGREDYVALRDSGLVLLDPSGSAWQAARGYSACSLPSHVAAHYATMDQEAVA